MVRKKVRIKNPTGMHLRPAGIFCKEAMKYQCSITFEFRNGTYNAKSVLGILGACVKCGDEIELICKGEDEKQALAALTEEIESGLGE
ncbi:MAG: HPr family phosphocarrier protein [Lachnospiraceae bacterium]|nr:HPr family phosphocarrier protein [Lachnospiraceae bacterium]